MQRILDERSAASARAHRLADGIDETRWAARPPRGGWSPAECHLHLNLTPKRFAPVLEEGIARARALPRAPEPPPLASRAGGGWAIIAPTRVQEDT